MKFWILEDMRSKRVEATEWIQWMENVLSVCVDITNVENIKISTVFIGGISLDSDDDFPLLFETMIFDGPLDESTWRYRTLGEAKQGHHDAVEKVRSKVSSNENN